MGNGWKVGIVGLFLILTISKQNRNVLVSWEAQGSLGQGAQMLLLPSLTCFISPFLSAQTWQWFSHSSLGWRRKETLGPSQQASDSSGYRNYCFCP